MQVTTDPESKNAIQEGVGFVASDSLAAESSAFSSASSVPAKSSTAATTDTSNATKLEPAQHASERKDYSGSYPDSIGKPNTGGTSSAGRSSSSKQAAGISAYQSAGEDRGEDEADTSRSSGNETGRGPSRSDYTETDDTEEPRKVKSPTDGSGRHVDIAPTYVHPQRTVADGKPKGDNLKEVESFEGNQSSDVTEIVDTDSSENPSRLAEQKFETTNAAVAGSKTGQLGQSEGGSGRYDALQE